MLEAMDAVTKQGQGNHKVISRYQRHVYRIHCGIWQVPEPGELLWSSALEMNAGMKRMRV